MAPLNRLLRGYKKSLRLKKIDWNDKLVAEAFEKTKRALADSTLLAYPKIDAKIGLFCDSSDESVASILAQQDSEGFYEPLGFYSSSLNNREKNVSTFQKELIAIYKSIRYFQDALQSFPFTIYNEPGGGGWYVMIKPRIVRFRT